MESTQIIREILGWSAVLNMGVLLFSFVIVVVGGSSVKSIHAKLFGLSESDLSRAYFQYLAQYKIAIFIFNLAPYVALKIIE